MDNTTSAVNAASAASALSSQVSASLKNKSGASAPPPNRIDDSLETTERESGGLVLSPNNEVESELESDSSATNGENLDCYG